MGLILTGYGDDAYDHEGYVAQVLDDGSLTSTYSAETEPRMVGQVVPACDCGWTGSTRYPATGPFDEAAEELAFGEWERDHVRSTLEGLRADRWDRLRVVLRGLVASTGASTTGAQFIALAPTDQRDVIETTLAALGGATELTRRLREPLDPAGGD